MPWTLLLLPLAIALWVAGPRLGNRAIALSGWLGWVVAGGILLGLPSIPPHSALDHRMLLTPLLLLPILVPKRWAVAALVLAAVVGLGFGLQSLWGRSALWENTAIVVLTVVALVGADTLVERSQRPWVVPILGIGVGIVIALNCSLLMGIEAGVIGGISLCLRGHPALNRGALLALMAVLAGACAYAEALAFLPLIACSVLALGVLRRQSTTVHIAGMALPLILATIPGAVDLMRSPI
ncbi:MAG: hypothetical protein ACI9VR_000974 [Cognaticolwellia sp.]|jgi:hypothetical protein